jgi:hypothetical protein
MERRIRRTCLICGKTIHITFNGREYTNGHYFGEIRLPLKPGKYKKIGTTKIGRNEIRTYGSYNLPLERLTPSAPQRGAVSPFAAFWEKLSWMSRTISML